jgi:hypothetical protein
MGVFSLIVMLKEIVHHVIQMEQEAISAIHVELHMKRLNLLIRAQK